MESDGVGSTGTKSLEIIKHPESAEAANSQNSRFSSKNKLEKIVATQELRGWKTRRQFRIGKKKIQQMFEHISLDFVHATEHDWIVLEFYKYRYKQGIYVEDPHQAWDKQVDGGQ